MSEFSPIGGKPRMTKSQIRRYQQQMQAKRAEAKNKLEEAKQNGDYYADDLDDLEKEIDNL